MEKVASRKTAAPKTYRATVPGKGRVTLRAGSLAVFAQAGGPSTPKTSLRKQERRDVQRTLDLLEHVERRLDQATALFESRLAGLMSELASAVGAAAPGGAHDPSMGSAIDARMQSLVEQQPVLDHHREANARLRAEFAWRSPGWTAAQVADFAQSTARNRNALASRWAGEKRIFGVQRERVTLFPSFQFNSATGNPYPELRDIIQALEADYEGWSLAIWFITPNDWLRGDTPLACWPDDRSAVVTAAQREQAMFRE